MWKMYKDVFIMLILSCERIIVKEIICEFCHKIMKFCIIKKQKNMGWAFGYMGHCLNTSIRITNLAIKNNPTYGLTLQFPHPLESFMSYGHAWIIYLGETSKRLKRNEDIYQIIIEFVCVLIQITY